MALIELLADLLPLRQTYANQAEAPPAALIGAIERMLPALRFFRLGDGSIAHFNGMGVTIQQRLEAVLRHDDTAGAPLLHAPHSGYERLVMGSTVVIADTGPPPPVDMAGAAHAGCLSFEMSSGAQQIVVNAGVDTFGAEEFRPLGRATAAHSTATVGDTSSARFHHPPRVSGILGAPLVGGPSAVDCVRQDGPDRQGFVAGHDGYVRRFGIYHERRLTLSDEGRVLDGTDRMVGRGFPADAPVAIRFHLHPDVLLSRDKAGRYVLSAGAEQWTFVSDPVPARLEDSLFFAASTGPRRSRQLVLGFEAPRVSEVRWRFARA
jgi:uncharacterized heparinase superfamily protein